MRRIGEVEHRDATLIPSLDHHVAAGNRNEGAVMRDAVLLRRLRRRHLVITLELQLHADDAEDRVGAPLLRVARAALRLTTATPLVREEQLGTVVVERRRMPVREVRIGDSRDADGMRRIVNVEKEAVTLARTTGEADRREHRDVMAL